MKTAFTMSFAVLNLKRKCVPIKEDLIELKIFIATSKLKAMTSLRVGKKTMPTRIKYQISNILHTDQINWLTDQKSGCFG